MKVEVGHEELWVICLGGHGLHEDPIAVELPDEVAARCKAAEEEWAACTEILTAAYEAEMARRTKARPF